MRVLVDSAFPVRLEDAPNREGVTVKRAVGLITDRDLIEQAARESFPAVVLLEAEIVSQGAIRTLARQRGVALICSTTDDPFEAETYLLGALGSLTTKVRANPGKVLWLRKDGLGVE
jgi:predicted nuclease of predicted toxin-antitoxin system